MERRDMARSGCVEEDLVLGRGECPHRPAPLAPADQEASETMKDMFSV